MLACPIYASSYPAKNGRIHNGKQRQFIEQPSKKVIDPAS
jgi:hypothetical protein